MTPRVQGFLDTVKTALSVRTVTNFLTARAAQGARVAPSILGHAGGLTQGAQAPAALRQVALGAGADARATQAAHALAPLKSGLEQRIAQTPVGFNASKPLATHDAFGHTHQYSSKYMNQLAGPAQIHELPGMAPLVAPSPALAGTVRARRPVPVQGATTPGRRVRPSLPFEPTVLQAT